MTQIGKNHALIRNLPNNISQPLKHPTSIDEWIKKIATLDKKTKKEVRTIVQKHTNKNIKKSITQK
jgi:hypothetical protein